MGKLEEREPKLIKDDNWNPVYLNRYGNETQTFRQSLEEFILERFRQVQHLIDLLCDEAWDQFGFVCQTLIEDGGRRVEALCELIKRRVGEIYVDSPGRTKTYFDGSLPFGVVLKPAAEKSGGKQKQRSEKDFED